MSSANNIFKSFIIIFFFSLIGCQQMIFNKNELVHPVWKLGWLPASIYEDKFDTLEPVFMWEPIDEDSTYDIAVWECKYDLDSVYVDPFTSAWTTGHVVYFRERIQGYSHKIQITLNPYSQYRWSVKKSGTQNWTKYYFFLRGWHDNHFAYFVTGGLDSNVSRMLIPFEHESKSFIPAVSRSNIYIIQKDVQYVIKDLICDGNFTVIFDGKQIGGITPETYHWIPIEPGFHVIIVSSPINTDTIELHAVEGINYFFEIKPEWPSFRFGNRTRGERRMLSNFTSCGFPGAYLEEVDEEIAREEVLKRKLITIPPVIRENSVTTP